MLQHLDAEQWQNDLEHLATRLRQTHRNLFHTTSPDAFDYAIRSLRGRIPSLAHHEVVVELARLVASIGDGHTVLRLTGIPRFQRYPLVLYQFSDGLHIRQIASEHAFAAGTRVLAIGDTPVDEAYAAMRPLVSHDNEMGIVAGAPALLGMPEVLHACGLVDNLEHVTFTVQLRDRTSTMLPLRSVPALPNDMADARDGAVAPMPLWLQRADDENWYERLPESNAIYVGFNRVRDGDDETLAAFFDRIFDAIEREGIERLILDIRLNHGGNNLLNRPLIHHLIRCDQVNRWGGLFAIIGRLTFSAAMNLAIDLERHTRVLFVGEPAGSSPNHYGENGTIVLPNSGLPVSVSTLWWQYSDPFDDRPTIPPDISARLTSADYAANHDPAMDAVLRYEPSVTQPLEYPNRLFAQLRRDDLLTPATAPGAAHRRSSSDRA